MGKMDLSPSEFWNITFIEFWAIFDAKFGHIESEKRNLQAGWEEIQRLKEKFKGK